MTSDEKEMVEIPLNIHGLISITVERSVVLKALETHTVKEPKRTIWVEEAAYNRGYVTGRTDCEKSHTVASPSNSEKEEHKHRMEDTPLNSEYCLDCGVVFGKKEEVKEEPTTPETKVKISCPDCPHEETDTPEKKCSDESMVASGYIKTPTGWIAQGEATPAQMVYHVSYEVTCGRCEKSIKHSCGIV